MNEHKPEMSVKAQIASELLRIHAIKLSPNEPFTWSSGWKSPIYCDNRMTLAYPDFRTLIKQAFKQKIEEKYPKVEAIAGVATAGIPQGALVADLLNVPFIYVRSKPKSHGMTNLIEGEIMPGKNIVVIEDLISTGGSAIKAIEAIREAQMTVLGLGAIFTYGFPYADYNLMEASVDYFTLSDYHALLDIAVQNKYIQHSEMESLNAWRVDPGNWNG